jgi:hypothetical protein
LGRPSKLLGLPLLSLSGCHSGPTSWVADSPGLPASGVPFLPPWVGFEPGSSWWSSPPPRTVLASWRDPHAEANVNTESLHPYRPLLNPNTMQPLSFEFTTAV